MTINPRPLDRGRSLDLAVELVVATGTDDHIGDLAAALALQDLTPNGWIDLTGALCALSVGLAAHHDTPQAAVHNAAQWVRDTPPTRGH